MVRSSSWWLYGLLPAMALGFGSGMPGLAHAKPRRFGGFGHGTLGIMAGDIGGLEQDLADSTALGDGAGPVSFGAMVGGGGRMLIGGRWLIGGKGFAVFTPRQFGVRGHASLVVGGGGLDFGVALVHHNNWLVYPYVGAGGMGLTLSVTAEGQHRVRLGEATIPAGERRSLAGGVITAELGAGVQRLFMSPDNDGRGTGGLTVGLELGFLYGFAATPWQADGEQADGADLLDGSQLRGPGLTGGYLRLTFGGGGFTGG